MKEIERFCIGIHAVFILILLHQFVHWLIPFAGYDHLTTSDWAAWVQAIGAILAIVGAFFIGERQVIAGRVLDRAHRADEDIRRFEIVMEILAKTKATAWLIGQSFQKGKLGDLPDGAIQYLADCTISLQQLPFFEMPHAEIVVHVTSLWRAVPELCTALEKGIEEAKLPNEIEFKADELIEAQINDVLGMTEAAIDFCRNEIQHIRSTT